VIKMDGGNIIVPNPHGIKIVSWPWGFFCPSQSNPDGRPYYIESRTGVCDCKAGQCKRPCKHKRWVEELRNAIWKQVVAHMTKGEAGWALLRQIESLIEFKE